MSVNALGCCAAPAPAAVPKPPHRPLGPRGFGSWQPYSGLCRAKPPMRFCLFESCSHLNAMCFLGRDSGSHLRTTRSRQSPVHFRFPKLCCNHRVEHVLGSQSCCHHSLHCGEHGLGGLGCSWHGSWVLCTQCRALAARFSFISRTEFGNGILAAIQQVH